MDNTILKESESVLAKWESLDINDHNNEALDEELVQSFTDECVALLENAHVKELIEKIESVWEIDCNASTRLALAYLGNIFVDKIF